MFCFFNNKCFINQNRFPDNFHNSFIHGEDNNFTFLDNEYYSLYYNYHKLVFAIFHLMIIYKSNIFYVDENSYFDMCHGDGIHLTVDFNSYSVCQNRWNQRNNFCPFFVPFSLSLFSCHISPYNYSHKQDRASYLNHCHYLIQLFFPVS